MVKQCQANTTVMSRRTVHVSSVSEYESLVQACLVMVSTSHSEQPTWSFSLSAMFSAPGIESMGSFTQQLGLQQSLVRTTTFSTFPGINSKFKAFNTSGQSICKHASVDGWKHPRRHPSSRLHVARRHSQTCAQTSVTVFTLCISRLRFSTI